MKTVNTTHAPAAIGPYVQGKIVNDLFFASGVLPINPETNVIEATTVSEQTTQIMTNVTALLKEVGSELNNIVKTTCFVTDMGKFAEFNEVYASYFGTEFPARSCVEVTALPKGALVEVEFIAEIK